MKTEIENAVSALVKKAAEPQATADESMKRAQAALSLVHALATLDNMRKGPQPA